MKVKDLSAVDQITAEIILIDLFWNVTVRHFPIIMT